MKSRWYCLGLLLANAMTGCGSDTPRPVDRVHIDLESRRPAIWLSEYHLFADLKNQVPNTGVVPYTLNASHFVDYAISHHYLTFLLGAKQTTTRATYLRSLSARY